MTEAFARYPSLNGMVVFVTGGASGIGADIVKAFSKQGAKVAFIDILESDGLATAKNNDALFLKCDITDIAALQNAIETTRNTLGPIGALVNNAANDDRIPVENVSVEYWDWSQAVNLRPHFFAAQAVRAQMTERGGGSIINFSSIAWRFGADNMVPYVTAKSGVMGLTAAMARNFGSNNIRINAIEPGAVMTDKQRKLWYPTQASVDAIVGRQILQSVLLGEDVARAVLFLAADDSRMITKQSIKVDAGLA